MKRFDKRRYTILQKLLIPLLGVMLLQALLYAGIFAVGGIYATNKEVMDMSRQRVTAVLRDSYFW